LALFISQQVKSMAAGSTKLSRKQAKAPDEFVNSMAKAYEFLKKWGVWIAAGVGVVLVVIIATVLLSRHLDSKKVDESTAFRKVFEPVMAAEVSVRDEPDEKAPEAALQARADTQKKLADAVTALDAFAVSHKGSPLAQLAVLGKSAAAINAGQFDIALQGYKAYLADDPQVAWAPMMWESLGYAADTTGKRDDAVAAFTEMGKSSSSLVRGTAFLHLGDMYNPATKVKNSDVPDTAKAREFYDKALKELAGEERTLPRLTLLTKKLVEERLVALR